jgi:uncharacterized membrane protein YdjX (TVP38/TMEM64 family)
MNRRRLVYRSVLVMALTVAILWLGLHRELLQLATIERELQRFGVWAPILFLLLYALGTVLFVPGSVLTLAGGALLGPIWGTLWNLSGATLGATLAFLIARYVASDWVAARSSDRLRRLIRGVEEERLAFRRVPVGTAVPVQSRELRLRIELSACANMSLPLLCMAPGALAYTYLGYAGREGWPPDGQGQSARVCCPDPARGRATLAAAGARGEGCNGLSTELPLRTGWRAAKKLL